MIAILIKLMKMIMKMMAMLIALKTNRDNTGFFFHLNHYS